MEPICVFTMLTLLKVKPINYICIQDTNLKMTGKKLVQIKPHILQKGLEKNEVPIFVH